MYSEKSTRGTSKSEAMRILPLALPALHGQSCFNSVRASLAIGFSFLVITTSYPEARR